MFRFDSEFFVILDFAEEAADEIEREKREEAESQQQMVDETLESHCSQTAKLNSRCALALFHYSVNSTLSVTVQCSRQSSG